MAKPKLPHAIVRVCAKCSDLWSHEVIGANGQTLSSYDGYVPSFMPGQHYGDYVMLEPWKRAKKPNMRTKIGASTYDHAKSRGRVR